MLVVALSGSTSTQDLHNSPSKGKTARAAVTTWLTPATAWKASSSCSVSLEANSALWRSHTVCSNKRFVPDCHLVLKALDNRVFEVALKVQTVAVGSLMINKPPLLMKTTSGR